MRDRLSSDNWRLLNRLAEDADGAPDAHRLAEALELLDHAIISLVAVGGLEMAHMTRDDGWRFLSLGRHLERLLYIVDHGRARSRASGWSTIRRCSSGCSTSRTASSRTARATCGTPNGWRSPTCCCSTQRNPRSAVFQLAKLAKHVPLLPGGG